MKALTGAGVITTALAALLAGGGGVALAQSAAGAVRQTARGSRFGVVGTAGGADVGSISRVNH